MIHLSWLHRIFMYFVVRGVLKKLNKKSKEYFSRQLAFNVRSEIIEEIYCWMEWARTHTPNVTADEDALQCAAWVLESDRLQRDYNGKMEAQNKQNKAKRDVHARWSNTN